MNKALKSVRVDPAARLLEELDNEVARFSPELEVLELLEEHFSQHGLAVPVRFKDESRDHPFFWVRFPLTLMPASQKPFCRLKCALEFNPGDDPRRPSTKLILPDRRFVDLMEAHTGLSLSINESFEFSPSLLSKGTKPPPPPGSGQAAGTDFEAIPGCSVDPGIRPGGSSISMHGSLATAPISLTADVKAAASLGVVAGPFHSRRSRRPSLTIAR